MVGRPRVHRQQRRPGAGRPVPDADLEGVHGRRAGPRADARLGAAARRRPAAGAAVPARQRVPGPGRDARVATSSAPSRRRAARSCRARPGSHRPRSPPPPPPPPETTPTQTTVPGPAPGTPITTPRGHPLRADRGRHHRAARRPRSTGPDTLDTLGHERHQVLTDDLLELQRIDTTTDQLAHRRAHLDGAGGVDRGDRAAAGQPRAGGPRRSPATRSWSARSAASSTTASS